MKKVLIGLLFLMLVGLGWGDSLTAYGDFRTSSQWKIYTETLTNAAVVQGITLVNPTVSISIRARGGDIGWTVGATATEAAFTIGQDQCYWDHFAIPMPAGKVLYFKPLVSGITTVEIMQNFR